MWCFSLFVLFLCLNDLHHIFFVEGQSANSSANSTIVDNFLTSTQNILGNNKRSYNVEVDVGWEFDIDGDFEGFANATSEEMKMDMRVENGELRGTILGKYFSRNDNSLKGLPPNFDSPLLFLSITGNYFVLRFMYYGGANRCRLLLRTGVDLLSREHIDHGKSYWRSMIPASVIQQSPAIWLNHSAEYLLDNNLYTYYLSSSSSAVSLTFDLHDNRKISSFSILPSGDSRSPRRCLLQASMTSGAGPFQTILQFTVLQNTSSSNNQFHNYRSL